MKRNVHGESSLVESFERKLTVHGYNWDGVNGGNKRGFIYSRTCKEVQDEVLFAFYVLHSKIIFSKPVFEAEQLFVREQLIFEVKDSRKREVVLVDKEFMADQMEFKLFDSILDCKNLFVYHMLIIFRVFELPACMCTEVTYTIYLFKKDGTPVIITGIGLQNALSSCGNLERKR